MRNDPVGLLIQRGFARRRVGPEIQLPSTSPFQGKKELVYIRLVLNVTKGISNKRFLSSDLQS